MRANSQLYEHASPPVRRELVLAAAATGEGYWIKERKDEFGPADPWLRRAIVAASRMLPRDEGKFWRKKIKGNLSDAEKLVAL
jgi:hypothetical protein